MSLYEVKAKDMSALCQQRTLRGMLVMIRNVCVRFFLIVKKLL